MGRLKNGLKRIGRMYRAHGIFPILSFYASKIYPLKSIFKYFSCRWLVRVKIHGSYMYLDAHDPGISTMLLTEGTREAGHVAQVQNNLREGMVGIDLGANIGYYALIEAQLVGSKGKIYAIEPEPNNLYLLKKNIRANDFESIFSVSRNLIGNYDGPANLEISKLSNRHSISASSSSDSIQVPMITLDTFMEDRKIKPEDIDFIRMDIEGYEVMAFQGMKKLMSSDTPLIVFIEFHPGWYGRWGWTFEKFLDYLELSGLHIKSLSIKGDNEIINLTNPTREEVMATQISPRTSNGGCHAFLQRG